MKAILTALPLVACGLTASAEVIRHPIPDSDFPIAQAVEIPGDAVTVYVSGTVPGMTDPAADPATPEAWGDTQTQSDSVFQAIDAKLQAMDLTMGDVVKLQVYLVGPDGGAMDFAGFMAAYTQYFGTDEQPNLPARSVFQVAGLANPHWLVEIEAVAVRP